MSPDTLLRQAHDLSQALQDQLEALPGGKLSIRSSSRGCAYTSDLVSRVFVHVDHEVDHTPVRSCLDETIAIAHWVLQEHRKDK